MEGLEELNLSDLTFDEGNEVFDVFKSKDTKPRAADGTFTKDVDIKDPTQKTTVSEDKVIPGPESVANKDNQGQDGKTVDTTSSNSSSPQNGNNEQLFSSLAAQLKSKGVLPSLDLENNSIKSLDDINAAISAEITGRLDEKQKAIEKAMSLGLDPKETAQQLQTINSLKKISPEFLGKPENDTFRKDVMIQDFVNKGYSRERADTMAQRSIDDGTGVEDATFALNQIISKEETSYNSKIESAEAKDKKDINDIKDLINKEGEILPGIVLDSQQKEAIYNQITTDLGNKENAFIRAQKQDPIGSRIKLETLFHLTKGLTDFTAFGKSQVQDVNKNFEKLLQGSSFAEEGRAGSNEGGDDSSFTLKDLKGFEFE